MKLIPEKLLTQFTMGGKVKLYFNYINESNNNLKVIWHKEDIDFLVGSFLDGSFLGKVIIPYRNASKMIYKVLKNFSISEKKIAVIGSQTPWIESLLISMGAGQVTTVEYNPPVSNHPQIVSESFLYFVKSRQKFDFIISYSSIEHSGLGRYGDQLDPNGDLNTVNIIHKKLKPDGLFILGVPVGRDVLVFNAHRIYGKHRISILLQNFKVVRKLNHTLVIFIILKKIYLFLYSRIIKSNNFDLHFHQPLFVLKKIENKL